MVAGGLGPLAGAMVCGWLRQQFVTVDGAGWDGFWGILAAMIGVCLALFLALYRGQPKSA
jgi:sugar phosphate permease